jgi:eukaryotic-like serine/threonine-protein kinase
MRLALLAALFMVMAGIGTYVALTLIIKGADTVVVPDLVGKDVLYSLEILSDLGLNTRVKGTAYHDQVPQNHVIDQDPDPGTAIKRGRDVRIRVSRGPQTIVMPNLTGLSRQQGEILLTENGLCRGAVAGMASFRHTAGQVIAQFPQTGTTVSRNTCIDLIISRGPPSRAFPMVDLSGVSLETAIHRLEQLQLTVGNIRSVHKVGALQETVLDQVPQAGYRVTPGGAVDLTVNRSGQRRHSGAPQTTNQVELFRFSLENGFLKKHVRVKMSQAQMSINLFDDFMAPGQEIWLLVPKSANPTVLVYVDGQLVDTRMMDAR